jgi:hypothetical protein
VKGFIDESPGIGAIPLACPVDFFQYPAVAIDEHRQGKLRCPQRVFHPQVLIDELADGCIDFFQQVLGAIRIVVRRNTNDREIAAFATPRETFQRRHFLPAWAAPACPNIDDERPAAKLAQLASRAVQPLQRRIGQSGPLLDGDGNGRRVGDGDRVGNGCSVGNGHAQESGGNGPLHAIG